MVEAERARFHDADTFVLRVHVDVTRCSPWIHSTQEPFPHPHVHHPSHLHLHRISNRIPPTFPSIFHLPSSISPSSTALTDHSPALLPLRPKDHDFNLSDNMTTQPPAPTPLFEPRNIGRQFFTITRSKSLITLTFSACASAIPRLRSARADIDYRIHGSPQGVNGAGKLAIFLREKLVLFREVDLLLTRTREP